MSLDTNAMEWVNLAATVRAADLPRYGHTAVLTGSVIVLTLFLAVLVGLAVAWWRGR